MTETVNVKLTDEVKESLADLGPSGLFKLPADHLPATSKHAAGRTKPQSKAFKARKHRRLRKQRQEYMSYIVDHRALNG